MSHDDTTTVQLATTTADTAIRLAIVPAQVKYHAMYPHSATEFAACPDGKAFSSTFTNML